MDDQNKQKNEQKETKRKRAQNKRLLVVLSVIDTDGSD